VKQYTFKEALQELFRRGSVVSEWQLRGALRTGAVSRPELDPQSLTFIFTDENLAEIAQHFEKKSRKARGLALA